MINKRFLSVFISFLFSVCLYAQDSLTIRIPADNLLSKERIYLRTEGTLLGFYSKDLPKVISYPVERHPTFFSLSTLNKRHLLVNLSPVLWTAQKHVKVIIENEDFRLETPYPNQKEWDEIQQYKGKKKIPIIRKNLHTYPAIYALYNLREKITITELTELYHSIPDSLKKYHYARCIASFIKASDYTKIKKGKELPDISLPDSLGKTQYIRPEKTSAQLIAYLGSGCFYSLASINELRDIYNCYSERLTITTIWGDQTYQIWQYGETERKKPICWTDLWDETELVSEVFDIKAFPTFVFVNSEGQVEKTWNRYKPGKLKKRVEKYLIR
ncbi:MAG: hypothetical protein R6V16_09370 [Bacteroidales bacterium]